METLIAKPINSGYTWTLTSRLGSLLQLAESQFGARDKDYTILGIEFGSTGPFIWYPGNCKNIAIQLSLESLKSERCALYELAHECIHLLSPTGKKNANVLEEGLATYFSWDYLFVVKDFDYRSHTSLKYQMAGNLVEKLLGFNPDFINDARKIQPVICAFSPEIFDKIPHNLTQDEINQLLRPFSIDQ